MKRLIVISLFTWMFILSACTDNDQGITQAAKSAKAFFGLLSMGNYSEAATYYGGKYDTLSEMNPVVDPLDSTTLWEQGCRFNGFQCLPLASIDFVGREGDTYLFIVTFTKADGTLFTQSACCGDETPVITPQSTFNIQVKRITPERYLVLTMPIYIP